MRTRNWSISGLLLQSGMALLVAALVATGSTFVQLGMFRDPSFDPMETIRSAPFLDQFGGRFLEILFGLALAAALKYWWERRQERSAHRGAAPT